MGVTPKERDLTRMLVHLVLVIEKSGLDLRDFEAPPYPKRARIAKWAERLKVQEEAALAALRARTTKPQEG